MAIVYGLERVFVFWSTFLLVTATLLFIGYVAVTSYLRRVPANCPPTVSDNLPLTGAIGFWTRRYDWFRGHASHGNFSFHAGQNTIVGLSGEKSRKFFFETPNKILGFGQGYAVLFGASPKVKDFDDGVDRDQDSASSTFGKRLNPLLKTEALSKKLSVLISDVHDALEAIQNEPDGRTDPYESIWRLVFRLTIRIVGADEIAEDPKLLEDTLRYFAIMEESSTAAAVMFPKLPQLATVKRMYSGARLFMMVEKIVKKRAESGEKHDDALQYMLDDGDRTFKIVEFICQALFAGLINSGIAASYTLCAIASSPEWLQKCRDEVRQVAAKYAKNPNAPLRHQLNDIPLEAWESEFPIGDLCLREAIRLNLVGTAFRRNVSGKPLPTGNGNEVIPRDAFVVYATSDVHLNPNIYPNPEKYDPARYLPGRAEHEKGPHAWIGWGVARHPCLGMRFAKLEQNLISAYFLATFDFHLEDRFGNKMTEPPKVDFNAHSAPKPKVPHFLRVSPLEK